MALSTAARRAIAIRNSIKRRETAQNQPASTTQRLTNRRLAAPMKAMHPRLLAMCVDAAGFDQNARYA